jgi:hypothetical protein
VVFTFGLALCVGLVTADSPAERLQRANAAFDRHNYAAALTEVEAYLSAADEADVRPGSHMLRALCLVALDRLDEGVPAAEALLDEHPELKGEPRTHELLAQAGEREHTYRYLAVDHYRYLADAWIQRGDPEKAAAALVALGNILQWFDEWDKVRTVPPPPDAATHHERFEYGRQLALACYKEAASLGGTSEAAQQALFARAALLSSSFGEEERDENIRLALETYEQIASTWPGTEAAARALLGAGELLEWHLHDVVAAVKTYQGAVDAGPRGSRAGQRAQNHVARIQAPIVELSVDDPAPPGKEPILHIAARNVAHVQFRIYRVDLLDELKNLRERYDEAEWTPRAHTPEREWSVDIPDDHTYRVYASKDTAEGRGRRGRQDTPDLVHIPSVTVPVSAAASYFVVADADGLYGRKAHAVRLILISRLELIAAVAEGESLLWVVDAQSGEPIADAVIQPFKAYRRSWTALPGLRSDDGGRCRVTLPPPPQQTRWDTRLWYAARSEAHDALVSTGYPRPAEESYRLYTITDRPIYRPGHTVHYKQVMRRQTSKGYEVAAHQSLTVELYNPRNEVVHTDSGRTDADGTFSGFWPVPAKPPLGVYRFAVKLDGEQITDGSDGGSRFRVEEYRKPEFEVTVSPAEGEYRIGDTISADIKAAYYFGDPVVGAEVSYRTFREPTWTTFRPHCPMPWLLEDFQPVYGVGDETPYSWWRWPGWGHRELVEQGTARTDKEGVAKVTTTAVAAAAQPQANVRYVVEADVADTSRRTISGSGSVVAAHAPLALFALPHRNVYHPGDTVQVDVSALDPNGQPKAVHAKVEMFRLKREERMKDGNREWVYTLGDRVAEGEVEVPKVGTAVFRTIADEAGPFRIVVTSDVAGLPAEHQPKASADVWVAQMGARFDRFAYAGVDLIFDKPYYQSGDTARVVINTRTESRHVWLMVSAGDQVVEERVVTLRGASDEVEIPLRGACVPEARVVATLVAGGEVHQDVRSVPVLPAGEALDVAIDMPGEKFEAGTQTQATVRVHDHECKPVATDVAVYAADASLYSIVREGRSPVVKHFYGQPRHSMVWFAALDGGGYDGLRFASVERRGRELHEMERAAAASDDASGWGIPVKAAAGKLAAAGEAAEEPDVPVRSHFADTIVWIANGRTDADGTLSVDVPFADDLTTWRLTAIAIDRETRVGEGTREVRTTKDIIARLILPRFLVEGDRALLRVVAHNDTEGEVAGQVRLSAGPPLRLGAVHVDQQAAKAEASGDGEWTIPITMPGKGEVRVDVEMIGASVGECAVVAKVISDAGSDGVERTLPVIPYGANKFVAAGGTIRTDETSAEQTVTLTLPERIDPNSPSLEVHVSPSIATVMLDALPYVLDYPYGCTEQTMSRFLPAVVTRHTLQSLGIGLADIRAKLDAQGGPQRTPVRRLRDNPVFNERMMNDIVSAGLERLIEFQQSDGGWGWWKSGGGDPYMTAYVVYGLAQARRADVAVDDGVLRRGVERLKAGLLGDGSLYAMPWMRRYEDDLRAWMLFAVAEADGNALRDGALQQQINELFDRRDGLTDYGRALLAVVLHASGDEARARIVVENFDNTVRVDEETDTASWGKAEGYWRWQENGLEATAMTLRALLTVAPEHPHIPRAVRWLVRNRWGAHWRSTKDTALVIDALAGYLAVSGELEPDMTVEVRVDDLPARSVVFTRENVLTGDTRLVFGAEHLPPGDHRVVVRREGVGTAYYSVYLDYYTTEDPITPGGSELLVQRSYHRLTPIEEERWQTVWDEKKQDWVKQPYKALGYAREEVTPETVLASGDLVEVQIVIDARNDFEYVMLVDPKPAGCEPVLLVSGHSWGEGLWANVELRDQHVALFASWVNQGKHPLAYRLRCETPGTFAALPTQAEAMYAPFARGNSASRRLEIHDPPGPASGDALVPLGAPLRSASSESR